MKNIYVFGPLVCAALLISNCGGGGSSPAPTVTPPPTPPAANTAPVVASAISDQSARVGQSFSFDATQSGATFTDADGDALTYTVSYAPSASGLTDSGGVITGEPTGEGIITVTVTANDGNGGTVSDVFDITVSEPVTPLGSKPNIVFVISDDQGLDASAQYSVSADVPVTPNFTSLADAGVVFDNAWVSPSCTPTRSALMTGKYSLRTDVFSPGDSLSASETVLHTFLENNAETSDYESALIGKWHLGGGDTGPNDFGIDYYAGITSGTVQNYSDWNLNVNGSVSNNVNYITSELTDQAINWVDDQDGPWFLWLAYNAPHTPFHLPPAELHSQTLSGTQADINANPRPYYLAAIEAMDTEFGRFWSSLSADEQDNTIVIFLGDNGTPSQVIDRGSYPTGAKGSLNQAGVAVPLFVSGAGVTRAGQREAALVTHTDIFATIAELAGADLPVYNDGQSFADLLSAAPVQTREFAYTESDSGWTVRNDQYKLVESSNGARDVFDLIADPTEQSDLLDGTADVSDIAAALDAAAAQIRGTENITGARFSNISPVCSDYAGRYTATANDVGRSISYDASLAITAGANSCTFTSNSLPNHDFNDGPNGFPNNTGPVTETFNVPLAPSAAGAPTALTLNVDNAIMLNGVKADVLAAACFGVGDERSGCGDINQPWRFDPMHAPNGFNVDNNNAHTQPDGAYHYHGPPPITNGDSQTASGVIGFAADGFPIFGPYFNDGGTVRTAQSSYALKSGARPTGAGDPGGTYDGAFRDDYEFVNGSGDLDMCNGMTVDGQYGYYVSGEYPYIIECFTGTPDPSFTK